MELKKEELLDFMDTELGIDVSEITESTPLFSSGIVDSFSLVSMLTHLEKVCNIRINPSEVNLDNMDSIERIRAFVSTKISP